MPALIRPSADPTHDVNVTECLVAALAAELWRRYGGNDVVNWLEAERHINSLIAPRGGLVAARQARPGSLLPTPRMPVGAPAVRALGRERRRPAMKAPAFQRA